MEGTIHTSKETSPLESSQEAINFFEESFVTFTINASDLVSSMSLKEQAK